MAIAKLAIATSILLAVVPASADTADDARATARFEEGRKLALAGRYAEACPKFEESLALAPSGGAVMNLADCYERIGRTASAYARFNEAAERAQKAGLPDVEKVARTRAAALQEKLSFVVIDIGGGTPREIRVDGVALDPTRLSAPLPLDPGPRHFEIVADKSNDQWFVVPAGPSTTPLVLHVAAKERRADSNDGMRTGAYVAGGIGAAGVVVAAITGVLLLDDRSTIARCNAASSPCSPDDGVRSRSAQSDAKSLLPWNGVAWAVGAAGLLTGATLYFLSRETSPSAGVGASHVRIGAAPFYDAHDGARGGAVSIGGSF